MSLLRSSVLSCVCVSLSLSVVIVVSMVLDFKLVGSSLYKFHSFSQGGDGVSARAPDGFSSASAF